MEKNAIFKVSGGRLLQVIDTLDQEWAIGGPRATSSSKVTSIWPAGSRLSVHRISGQIYVFCPVREVVCHEKV